MLLPAKMEHYIPGTKMYCECQPTCRQVQSTFWICTTKIQTKRITNRISLTLSMCQVNSGYQYHIGVFYLNGNTVYSACAAIQQTARKLEQEHAAITKRVSKGLTSHSTLYRSFRGRLLQGRWPNQQHKSTAEASCSSKSDFNPTISLHHATIWTQGTASEHSVRVPVWQKPNLQDL